MPTYKYRAKKGPEDIIEGKIEALSEKSAVEKLSQAGYLPVRIELDTRPRESPKAAVSKPQEGGNRHKRVKSREVTVLSRELASLLKSGVPILRALDIISEASGHSRIKDILYGIRNDIKEGSAFSSCLLKYPAIFNPVFIALIKSGEDGGSLPQALLRIAEYRARQEEMLSRLRMALAYPVFMAAVGIATVTFMLTYVMPRLTGLFVNTGQSLPLPTQILISVSSSLRQWGFWIVLGLSAFILIAKRQLTTPSGRLFLSSLKLRLPVFGKFILKGELARFSRTLELLIKNGITILKALDIAIPVLSNDIIKNQLRKSVKDLQAGGSFGRSLKGSKLFPHFMANLIAVGEESGRLSDSLQEIADSYERDTDEQMRVMSSLLEPLMILIIGSIVGFIVVAMLLPIFEINTFAG
jgi:type II secretory pathway component PulF